MPTRTRRGSAPAAARHRLTMASCRAYSTINGVMIPGVSAGSNHVGASVYGRPGQLPLRDGGKGRARHAGDQAERGKYKEVAASQVGLSGARSGSSHLPTVEPMALLQTAPGRSLALKVAQLA